MESTTIASKRMNSAFRCFRYNKSFEPLGLPPLILVVAQATDQHAFAEFYAFTGLKGHEFLHGDTGYQCSRSVTPEEFAALVTCDSLIESELARAKALLEHTLHSVDDAAYRSVYWSGATLELVPIIQESQIAWALLGRSHEHVKEMFELTDTEALESLKKRFLNLTRILRESK